MYRIVSNGWFTRECAAQALKRMRRHVDSRAHIEHYDATKESKVNKIPFIYSGFRTLADAEAFAASVNEKGGKAEAIARTPAGLTNVGETEFIVVALEDDHDTPSDD